jgi:hypothetical protein
MRSSNVTYRAKGIVLVALLLSNVWVGADDKAYRNGILEDVQIGTSIYGSTSVDDKFDLTINDGQTVYVARYLPGVTCPVI